MIIRRLKRARIESRCVRTGWRHGAMAREQLTVGVLKFGTVNWQLRTDQRTWGSISRRRQIWKSCPGIQERDKRRAAGRQADMIVTDWIWASAPARRGRGFRFVPYTRALGA